MDREITDKFKVKNIMGKNMRGRGLDLGQGHPVNQKQSNELEKWVHVVLGFSFSGRPLKTTVTSGLPSSVVRLSFLREHVEPRSVGALLTSGRGLVAIRESLLL